MTSVLVAASPSPFEFALGGAQFRSKAEPLAKAQNRRQRSGVPIATSTLGREEPLSTKGFTFQQTDMADTDRNILPIVEASTHYIT